MSILLILTPEYLSQTDFFLGNHQGIYRNDKEERTDKATERTEYDRCS